MLHHPVNWPYVLTMAVAIGAGLVLVRRGQRQLSLHSWEKLGVAIGAFCGSMIGAKLPFVLADWQGMLRGTAWLADGKTIMSGLVGGYFGVELAKWILDIHVRTGDTFALPAAVAVGIGRLGCFWAGCCFGLPTLLPWGVVFPTADALPRHPTQLYEAAFHLTAAVGLAWLARLGWFPGQRMKLYLIAYLGYRLVSEALRPEIPLWLNLTGYQWACLVLLPTFIWLWMRDRTASARLEESGRAAEPQQA